MRVRRSTDISAGLLAYRQARRGTEVLLAHPGGPFWTAKDDGAWTIPKGLVTPGEALETAAQREFSEETNLSVSGALLALKPVSQRSGKTVHAFAVEADLDIGAFASNTFDLEWPPRSGRVRDFPEIDRIGYFELPAARIKIIAYQRPLLRELEEILREAMQKT